jgi:hypothetical protein
VQILERDGDRALLGEALQPVPHDLERPVLEGLRGELTETRLVIRLEREPEHRGEIRGELSGAITEEPLDVATERHADPHLRLVREDPEPRSNEVPERPVGHRLAVGDALALEPSRATLRRRALDEHIPEFRQEPRLADPGLAGHDRDRPGALEGGPREASDDRELPLPPDDWRLDALDPSRRHRRRQRSDHGPRGDPARLPLHIELHRGSPLEEGLHASGGALPDEDRARLGLRLEPRRHVHGVSHRPVLHAGTRADRAHHDGSGLDADPDAEAVDPPAPADLVGELAHLPHDP